MVLRIDVQIYYFLSTILAGIVVGVMFDTYRILRGFNCPNKLVTAVSDMLFWIFAAVLTFIFMLYTNNGDLRYYIFVGLFLGLFIYFKLISKKFANILRYTVYIIIKSFRIIINLILYPMRLIRYAVNYLLFKLSKFKKVKVKGLDMKTSVKKALKKFKPLDKKPNKNKQKSTLDKK
jgi:spore cortex biosynthesis protein YabQ